MAIDASWFAGLCSFLGRNGALFVQIFPFVKSNVDLLGFIALLLLFLLSYPRCVIAWAKFATCT